MYDKCCLWTLVLVVFGKELVIEFFYLDTVKFKNFLTFSTLKCDNAQLIVYLYTF